MLDFANPILLILLVSLPVVYFLYWLAKLSRRRKIARFGNPSTLAPLMPDASHYKAGIKITLQLIALAAVVIILARPRFGETEQTDSKRGIEVMIAFDASRSMLAASTDDPKSISRLKRAKLLLEKLTDRLGNDKVGLVVFAGDAKVKLPLTTDYYSAKLILNDLDPSLMPYQGTSISEAINLSKKCFSNKKDVKKCIILLTDAEDHDGNAIDATKAVVDSGIQVNVIGVGTSKGARIPIGSGYLTDNDGKEVITAVNENAAKEIAKAGKGLYVNGSNTDALDKLVQQLDNRQKSDFGAVKYKNSAEQFPLFAWLALTLLICDILLLERKTSWLKHIHFFAELNKKKGYRREKK